MLLKTLVEKAEPGRHLPAGFDRYGLYPVSLERAVERIPSRRMVTDSEEARQLMDSTLGEQLESLRGVGSGDKPKPRGKKVTVPPGKSHSARKELSEEEEDKDSEEEDSVDVDDLLDGDEEPVKKRGGRRRLVLTSDEEEEEEEEDYNDDEDDDGDDGGDDGGDQPRKKEVLYPVGSYCLAVYDGNWYVAQVEGEEPENECDGFTLLNFMLRKGHNQFLWGNTKDTLKTINSDILLKVDAPIPVSNRCFGVAKDVAKEADKLLMVKRSIFLNTFFLFLWGFWVFFGVFSGFFRFFQVFLGFFAGIQVRFVLYNAFSWVMS